MPVILLYNFEAAIFRSVGDTKVPLIALTVSGVLNVILNLFFVIVLKMNVNGVAIATVLSNAVSSVLLLRRLLHGDLVRVELKQLRIDPAIFRKIMRIGLPAGIQSAIFSVSNIIIQSAINSLGTVVMAASSAAFNIEIIAYDVLNSFSQACTTFVGQNYGAGKIDRCKKTMLLSSARHHRLGHRHRDRAADGQVSAGHFQQRPAGHRDRLQPPAHSLRIVYLQPDV